MALIDRQFYPPCVLKILHDLKAGANVNHTGRMAFATFAMGMGVSPEDVATAYANTPNFDARKSASQIESLRDHTPPNCTKMQAAGLCSKGMQAPLCGSVRNPISFGRIRAGTYEPLRVAAPTKHIGAVTVAVCPCGWQSRPLPGPLAGQVAAAAHASLFDEEQVLGHIAVQYVEARAL